MMEMGSGGGCSEESVVVSSLVVDTLPPQTAAVAASLSAMEGVEVHETVDYKLVVTIEADSTSASHRIASSFVAIPGVTGVGLVYCNFEDEFASGAAGR